MRTAFIEVTNGPRNHGKFMVARFDAADWAYQSRVEEGRSLIARCGWTPKHILVTDLQTGEGAIFLPGGYATADLDKHAIWVCPLFEPFLTWLYEQDLSDLHNLPALIDLPEAPFAMAGYRRPGPERSALLALLLDADAESPDVLASKIDALYGR